MKIVITSVNDEKIKYVVGEEVETTVEGIKNRISEIDKDLERGIVDREAEVEDIKKEAENEIMKKKAELEVTLREYARSIYLARDQKLTSLSEELEKEVAEVNELNNEKTRLNAILGNVSKLKDKVKTEAPVVEEAIPVVEETAPVVEETTSVVEEVISEVAPVEPVEAPVVEESAAVKAQIIEEPVVEETKAEEKVEESAKKPLGSLKASTMNVKPKKKIVF